MKKLLSLLLIICSIGVAYADDKSTVTSLKYVTDELNTRQDKFGANDGKAMTFTNVAGGNAPRDVKTNLGSNTSDTGLPTVSAVNAGLENKQDEIGAANTNTVVTYTGTPGTLGQKGIYQDTGTYASQQDNLIDAGTFNAALKTGLDSEFICADTDPVSGNCWLWTIHNEENKNLIDWSQTPTTERVNNGIWSRYNVSLSIGNGDWTCKHSPTLPIGTYTISGNALIFYVVVYNTSEVRYVRPTKTDDIWKTTVTLTAPSEIWICSSNSSGMAAITQCQIEEGSNATTYQAPTPYTTLLPSGYTPVEYIESTGTQYIDTGFSPLPDDDLSVEFEFYSNQIASGKNICGVGVGEWSTGKGWQIGFAGTAGGNSWNQKRVSDVVSSQMGISARVWYKIKVNSMGYFVNNVLKKQISAIEAYTTDLGNFYIFRANNKSNGSINFNDFSGRIGIFSLFKNGVLVFNGIPAKHGNVVGMYDTVSGTFKENAGTGTFTAGPDISNVVYIPQN